MRCRTIRRLSLLSVLLASPLAGAATPLEAAAARSSAVDLVTVPMGSVARGARSTPRTLPIRAELLGVTWRGEADGVELRARGVDGEWSRWVPLEAGVDGPDPRSAEARTAHARAGRAGRRTSSNPVWVGDAQAVQVRAHDGEPARDVQAVAINTPTTAPSTERVSEKPRSSHALAPGIRLRSAWGARAARSAPSLGEGGVLGVVVHHTDGTNRYSCAQVPALLRGIQQYHMRTNGWNDIGYNYLVDACGGVWEGRAGGLTNQVVGAHTAGFNTSTSGIALIGNHVGVRPTAKARAALQRLVSWRLDAVHVSPVGPMALVARSGDKFPVNSRVVVRAVSGHRDLFPTACPGALAYRDLSGMARAAWLAGGPKVANITLASVRANPADVTDATLASATVRAIGNLPGMTLSARFERISTSEVLRQASVVGTKIAAKWIATPGAPAVPAWDVRVVVEGSLGARRSRIASRPLVANLAPDPGFVITSPPAATVAPGGDPLDDRIHLQYTLASRYQLGAWLHDPATGEQITVLRAPGYIATTSTPKDLNLRIPAGVQDGSYELRVGLPNDPAAGRSIRSFALTITRAA